PEDQIQQVVAGVQRAQADADGDDEERAPGARDLERARRPPPPEADEPLPHGQRGAGTLRAISSSSSPASSRENVPWSALLSIRRCDSVGTINARTSPGVVKSRPSHSACARAAAISASTARVDTPRSISAWLRVAPASRTA